MKIQIPTRCPSCDAELEQVNSQLFCRNESCPAQSSKKVEAFAKKMKIKGLGPASISKLELTSVNEIYELDLDYLVDILGDKIGKKIYNEIDKTIICDFPIFLSALSIPLIGTTASEKIGSVVNNFDDINNSTLLEAGVGEKARFNLLNWLASNDAQIPKVSFKQAAKKKANEVSLGKVCITGKLTSFKNRNEAAAYLKSLGYTVTTTVSKQTDYLVDEEGKVSSKRTKAEKIEIPIVTIEQLKEKVK
jgi:DNA ligase (NAD+)